jgi:hypothetical protein
MGQIHGAVLGVLDVLDELYIKFEIEGEELFLLSPLAP